MNCLDFNIISKNPQIIELPNNIFGKNSNQISLENIYIGYSDVIDDNDDIQQIIVFINKKRNITNSYLSEYSDDHIIIAVTTTYRYIYLNKMNIYMYGSCINKSISVRITHTIDNNNINKNIKVEQDITENDSGRSNIKKSSKTIIYDYHDKKYKHINTGDNYMDVPYESKNIIISKCNKTMEYYASQNIQLSDEISKLKHDKDTLDKQHIVLKEQIITFEQNNESNKLKINKFGIKIGELNQQIIKLQLNISTSDNIISDYKQKLDICSTVDTHILLNAISLLCHEDMSKRLGYLLESIKIQETIYATNNILEILVSLPKSIMSTYIILKEYKLNINTLLFSKYGKYINKYTLFGKNMDCSKCSKNTVHIPLECCHYICCDCIFSYNKCFECKCIYGLDFSIKL